MEIARLGANGSLTLPGELLARLGLREGDRLEVEVNAAGRLVLVPVQQGVVREAAAIYRVGKHDLALTSLVKKEDDQYTALCLELDIASCGDTPRGALAALRDATDTYIEHLTEQGRADQIYRPVPLEALREFLLGENAGRSPRPVTVRGFALESRHA